MNLRKAQAGDIPAILTVMEAARGIMRASGNPFQWPEGYPSSEKIAEDLAAGVGYVLEEDGIVGYFACIPGPDPTYTVIEEGAWLDDEAPYYVIHRIASQPQTHGVFAAMLAFAGRLSGNLRIDTHRDNRIMQHLLQKHGFSYCGIIHLLNGEPRLAYQRI